MTADTPDRLKQGSLIERLRSESGVTAADIEALVQSIQVVMVNSGGI